MTFIAGIVFASVFWTLILRQAHYQALWLQAYQERTASVACAVSFTIGQYDSYLERIADNFAETNPSRAHAASTHRFILQGLFRGP